MKILILCLFSIILFNFSLCDTYDPEFESLYSVNHLKEGDGRNFPRKGDRVSVHYKGTFPDTGKKFDSSYDRKQPFSFTLGKGAVIKCWDEVLSQMSKGEKIYVVCPSRLAYGSRGAGEVIPPDTDIAFTIELLDFPRATSDL